MSSLTQLKQAGRDHSQLRERLKEQFALNDGDEVLTDTLDGISDFKEMCLYAIRQAQYRAADAQAVASIIADNQARKERHEKAAKSIRELVKNAMADAGETTIKSPDLTLSIRNGGRKLIIDKERVPHSYCMQVITFVPDREKIEAAIAVGDVPVGVEISNGEPSLSVRAK